jgi:hypothetical protein
MFSRIDQLQHRLLLGRLGLHELLAIRRELRAPFRLHPLGFLACTLLTEETRKIRLHYWPLAGGAQQSPECQIHDHLFEFRSWVLGGTIENAEYVVSPEGKEFSVYHTEYSDHRSTLTKTSSTVRLSVLRRRTYSAGSSYEVAAGVLHETVRTGTEPAFTVLVTNDVSSAAPLVLGPTDGSQLYTYERAVLDDAAIDAMLTGAFYLPKDRS